MANTSRSNSTKKRTTTSSRSNSRKKSYNQSEPMSEELIDEIFLIVIGAVALFLFLCNFGILGSFGNAVRDITFGVFGLPNYVMPIVIAFLVVFGIVNAGDKIALRKTIASVFLYLNTAFACELIWNAPVGTEGLDIKAIYNFASTNHKGGGFFGGIMAYLGIKYLDTVGSVLLILVAVIICLIIITNKSIVRTVKDSSYKAYEKASDSALRNQERRLRQQQVNDEHRRIRQEQRQERAKERELRKEVIENEKILRKAQGVPTYNFVANEEVPSNERDDIHEINLTDIDDEYDNREVELTIHGIDNTDNKSDGISEIKFHGNVIEEDDDYEEDEYIYPPADADAPKPIARASAPRTPKAESVEPVAPKSSPKSNRPYKKPPISLLTKGTASRGKNTSELKATAAKLEEVLLSFGVKVTVTDISQGPSVTRYEMIPETGVKVSKIVGLSDDIKLNLAAADIRIEAPIPGKAAIGIEVPNKESSSVLLRDLFETKDFSEAPSKISFAVGKDLAGKVVVTDIAKMPHMLIAGATGSGKSVCINTLIMSILYKANPDEVKLILIDPKVVELSVYNGIPHLLIPVVTDPKKASAALAWAVAEMNDRYQKFADYGVRDLKGYNERIKSEVDDEGNPLKPMFQLVVIVDELADMMMVAGKEVEESICRLAQLARAAGIHLILATQRPSVDVITGLIKANMPSRIAFSVSSGVDSRTILDMNGAEKLLGKGDMLFYPQGYTKPARVQGAFISDKEVSDVVSFLKNQQLGNIDNEDINSKINSMTSQNSSGSSSGMSGGGDLDYDEYFVEAGRLILETGKCSIGMLQRKFKIGFNRAARIMDSLSEANVVGPEEGTKPRTILMTIDEFEEYVNNL